MQKDHDKYIRSIRKIMRVVQPVVRGVRKTKHILLYCDSVTMGEHIIDFYENTKDIECVKYYLFYVDGQNNYARDNLDSGIQKIVQGRNIVDLKQYPRVVFHFWDLIVCADTFLPFHFGHKDAPAIYVNHGLHIISFDQGENLYAYTDHWALDIDGEPKFAAMFEPNKRYAKILREEKIKLKDVICHVGYKYSENILAEKKNYYKYRQELGIADNETVVSVFSTWRQESLFQKVGHELIEECKKLQGKGYRFILSDHPREYFKYDEDVEPTGPYVDSLADEGFLVRHPDQYYMPYLIAADLVICDYSTFYELALLAGKKLILSEFSESRVWKNSIARELMCKIPVIHKDTNLEEVIQEVMNSNEYNVILNQYGQELVTDNKGYKETICNIVKQLLTRG